MKLFRNLGIYFLIFIVLYAVSVPVVGLDLYRVFYPCLALFICVALYSHGAANKYYGKLVGKTSKCWILLAVWGLLLAFLYGTVRSSVSYIWYDICIACVILCWAYWSGLKNKKKAILFFFWLFSSAVAITGIYEGLTGNYYHLTHVSYLYYKNDFGLYRPNTIFYNVNDSATFMFFALVNGFLYAEEARRGKMIRISSMILFGGNILFTGSRGAELAMALFLAIYFIAYTNTKKKIVYFIIFLPVVLFGAVFIADILLGNLAAGTGRTAIWEACWENLKRSRFMGVGPGNIVTANTELGWSQVAAVHNFAFEIFCDYGIIGFLLLLDWYVSLFKYSFLKRKQFRSANLCFAALTGFLPISISSSSLILKSWLIPFFAIIVISLNAIERSNVNKA